MNRNKAIDILEKYRFDPYTIARHLTRNGIRTTENTVLRYFEYRDKRYREIEKDYRKNELPKVQQNIREMIQEVPQSERDEMRRRYLLEQVREAKQNPTDQERIKKLSLQVHIFTGRQEGISPEQIVQATKFPIEKLIKVNRGMALCPFHNEKTPSLNVRNNFYYCHGCGATGNTIHLVRHLENLSFKEAVNRLT